MVDSSFYNNCRHSLPVNGNEIGRSHLFLMMYQISFASFGINYSNFSNGSNMFAGVLILIPRKSKTNEIKGGLMFIVHHCLFINNTGIKGGGLFLLSRNYLDVSILISHSEFLYNKVNTGAFTSGGMSLVVGLRNGSVKIDKSLFQGNFGGGALISYYVMKEIETLPITVVVSNSTFRRNLGRIGAGLKILASDQDGSHVLVANTAVTYNYYTMKKRDFGALYFFCFVPFVPIGLKGVTVLNNNMTGILASNCRLLVIEDTSIVANNTVLWWWVAVGTAFIDI